MRILKVEPGKAPYAKEMAEGLKAIQREVEGLFQPLSMGDGVILRCVFTSKNWCFSLLRNTKCE